MITHISNRMYNTIMSTGSTIVYGNSSIKRLEKIKGILYLLDPSFKKSDHPDLKIVSSPKNSNSIGIGQAREVIKFLSTKPYSSKYKVVVIDQAEKLTIQAQNALLKTLEEPSEHTVIYLSVKTEQDLIPTIISRCRKFDMASFIKEEELIFEKDELKIAKDLKVAGLGEKMEMAESIAKKEKDEILSFLDKLIVYERRQMLENPNTTSSKNLELMLETGKEIEGTNIITRLALENLFFNIR